MKYEIYSMHNHGPDNYINLLVDCRDPSELTVMLSSLIHCLWYIVIHQSSSGRQGPCLYTVCRFYAQCYVHLNAYVQSFEVINY